MMYFVIVFFLASLVLWFIESRIFLLVFQKLCYKTYDQVVFPDNVFKYFPQHRLLDENVMTIREELMSLMNDKEKIPKLHELDHQNKKVSFDEGPGWRTYYLKAYNGWFNENCHRCPQTSLLLREMDNVLTAMFSVMEPGNKIPPHTGKFNGFLRYQLPLVVPKTGGSYITVGEKTHHYEEGKGLIFDDTILHSASNESDGHRVVLFLDIDKKASWPVYWINRFLMWLVVVSPTFQKGEAKAYKK